MVEFSAEEGYVAGELVGQLGYWSGSEDGNVVDLSTNYLQLSSATNLSYRQNTYSYPLDTASDVVEVGGTFRFNRSTNEAPSKSTLMIFALKEGTANSAANLRAQLERESIDTYSLAFNENSGDNWTTSTVEFAESELGLAAGDEQSDDLGMSLSVTPGISTNDWQATVILSNVTAGVEITRLMVPAGDLVVSESWNNALALYGNINSAREEFTTLTSDRQVERFYVNARNFTTPYEEWAILNGVGGMEEDPDEDGLNNLGEYALAGDPNDPEDRGVQSVGPTFSGGTNFFSYTHAMLIDTTGVEYAVEVNDMGDLVMGGWTNTGITVTSGPYDADYILVTNSIPTDDETKGFLRLRIEQN